MAPQARNSMLAWRATPGSIDAQLAALCLSMLVAAYSRPSVSDVDMRSPFDRALESLAERSIRLPRWLPCPARVSGHQLTSRAIFGDQSRIVVEPRGSKPLRPITLTWQYCKLFHSKLTNRLGFPPTD